MVMAHHGKAGAAKFRRRCSLALNGKGVFEINRKGGGARLIELASGVRFDELRSKTEASLTVAKGLSG